MQPLSLLPLFMDLRGKCVLVAGDSAGLVWKVELLAASGADLAVFCADPDITKTILELQIDSAISCHERQPNGENFVGMAFAVGAFDVEASALEFEAMARAAHVLVNLVDRPAISDVQFGAIVNRSPIVAAIATDGKAPSLGRAIRNRFEAMLPPEIAAWALAADQVRAKVSDLDGPQKRAFWAAYAQKALADPKADPSELDVDALVAGSNAASGALIVIDVGPPNRHDLITLEALSYLQRADLVLSGPQVDPRILDLMRREALLHRLVNKRDALAAQEIALAQAQTGSCVIWLHVSGQSPDLGGAIKSNSTLRYLSSGQ